MNNDDYEVIIDKNTKRSETKKDISDQERDMALLLAMVADIALSLNLLLERAYWPDQTKL